MGRYMGTDERPQAANIDLYSRCLAFIEADQIAGARRQARRIEDAALRAIAEGQIRLVLDIKACLVNGDVEQARKLSRALIGGIKLNIKPPSKIARSTATGLLPPG